MIKRLMTAAFGDSEYTQLLRQIAVGWPESPNDLLPDLLAYHTFSEELSNSNGLVFKGHCVVVPLPMRADILDLLHAAHTGVNGCLRRSRETVFWPCVTADIKRLAESCQMCARYQQAVQKEPLMSHAVPNCEWQKVGTYILTSARETIS